MTVEAPILVYSRILDSSRRSRSSLNGDIAQWDKTKEFIVAVLIDEQKGPWTASYKLRWRDVTDSGSFVDLASSGEIKWGTGTVLVNGDSVATYDRRCQETADASFQNGYEVEGAAATPSFALADEYFTELQFACNASDSQVAHVYEFELYDATNGASRGTLQSSITMMTYPSTVLNTPTEGATVTQTPTLNFTGTDPESDTVEYNVQIDQNVTFDSQSLSTIDSYSESNYNAGYGITYVTTQYGQSFTGSDKYLTRAKLYLRKTGSPTGNIYIDIYTHSGTYGSTGIPDYWLTTSEAVNASTLTTSFALIDFIFKNAAWVASGVNYFWVIRVDGGIDTSNYVSIGYDSSGTHGGNYVAAGVIWSYDATKDFIFYLSGGSAGLNKYSDTDSGFTSGHPYTSGVAKEFTVQSGDALSDGVTYYWRGRTRDTVYTSNYGEFTTARSFDVSAIDLSEGAGYQTSYKVGSVSQKQPALGSGYQTSYAEGDASVLVLIDVSGYGYQTSYGEGTAVGPVLAYGLGYQTSYGEGDVVYTFPVVGLGYQTSYADGEVSNIFPVWGLGYQFSYSADLVYVRYAVLENVEGVPFDDKYNVVEYADRHRVLMSEIKYGVLLGTKYGVSTFHDAPLAQEFKDKHVANIISDKFDSNIFPDNHDVIVND